MRLLPAALFGLVLPVAVFANTASALINSQGWAQRDLSIRGSSYTGAGTSINGLNVKVPYSAHYNSELSMHGYLPFAAETKNGLENVSGHSVGTLAYTIAPLEVKSEISAGIGTKERYQATLYGSDKNLGGFIDWEKAHRIDHDNNDLDRLSGGAFVQFVQNDWLFDILSIGQNKAFGAQGYYGIPSTVYAEERSYDDLLFASATKGDLDDAFFRTSIAGRWFDHEYRIPTSSFTSDVLSRFGALAVEGRTMEIQHIAVNLRGDVEVERVSGDIGHHDRTRGSVLILPEARFEKVVLKAGVNSVFQTSESAEWLPQAGVDFFLTDNSVLYASYSKNVQQPDYQMLYYTDPFHTGNTRLNQQKVQSKELGFRQFLSERIDWNAAAFYRRIENANDWTKSAAADVAWAATDLGTLSVFGAEAELNYYPSDKLDLSVFYQWVHKEDYDFYAGLYELDYHEHLLNFAGYWDVIPEVQLFATQTLRQQTSNNVRSGNDFGADASVGLHWLPRFANNVRLSFLVDNLWGTDFQAVPGLKPPKRTYSTRVAVTW